MEIENNNAEQTEAYPELPEVQSLGGFLYLFGEL